MLLATSSFPIALYFARLLSIHLLIPLLIVLRTNHQLNRRHVLLYKTKTASAFALPGVTATDSPCLRSWCHTHKCDLAKPMLEQEKKEAKDEKSKRKYIHNSTDISLNILLAGLVFPRFVQL